MDKEICGVMGIEGLLRKELPEFYEMKYLDNPRMKFFVDEIIAMKRVSTLILNTFDNIESPCLPHIASLFSKIYTVASLHVLSNTSQSNNNACLWKEDDKCLTWLDSQPSRSVLYVSFGSLVRVTSDQLTEFWHALVNSGYRFLLVVRRDVIEGEESEEHLIRPMHAVGPTERGFIVGWAPQEQVLAHKAVGGFLIHGGWNSVLESIVAGVPLICWPHFGDQHIISRYVSQVWRIGLQLEACERSKIEMLIEIFMETQREEIQRAMDRMRKLAWESVSASGSSYHNLEMLVEDIKKMKPKNQ